MTTGPHVDAAIFIDNFNKLWPDANLRFPGEHVAWSLDGTQMLAHAPSDEELYAEMDRHGKKDFVSDDLVPGDCFVTGSFLFKLLDEDPGGRPTGSSPSTGPPAGTKTPAGPVGRIGCTRSFRRS